MPYQALRMRKSPPVSVRQPLLVSSIRTGNRGNHKFLRDEGFYGLFGGSASEKGVKVPTSSYSDCAHAAEWAFESAVDSYCLHGFYLMTSLTDDVSRQQQILPLRS